MTFMHLEYLWIILLFMGGFVYLYNKHNKRFYAWVKDHWFLGQSKSKKLSNILYLVAIFMLCLGLLDLRGPEKLVEGKVSDQKTIILIDSSASMLAEDVRPNRFKKALLLVKHYVKKAVGQQVSLVVFSDGQKRIIPFTDDIDLVEARVSTLDNLELSRGGTGLSLAIQESIQYFRETSKEMTGNILIFTDAEETDGGVDLNIPDSISVGVVGVGTAKGAPIPTRDRRGVFRGNKKHQGKVVISKLNESFLKNLGSKIENFRYWVATSYTLPTEEIIKFFNHTHKVKNSKNSFRIRPVLSNYLIIPALLILGISLLLNRKKTFVPLAMLFVLLSPMNLRAQEKGEADERKPEKQKDTLELEQAFVDGKLSDKGKKALAGKLLRDGFHKDSLSLYEETMENSISNDNFSEQFNYATAKLKNRKIKNGIDHYNKLLKHLKENKDFPKKKEMEELIKKNLITAFKEKQGGKGNKKQKNDDQDQDQDKKDQKGSGEGKDQKNNDSKSDQSKDGKKDNKDKKDQKDKKDGDQNKDKKKDQKDGGSKKNKKKDQNQNDGKKDKKSKKGKMPALLKQLMSDDNQLQKKMIDAKTTKRKSSEKKDW